MRALHGGRVRGGRSPGDKWARLFRTFRPIHGTRPNAPGLRPLIAECVAGSLGRQARLFWSWVVARSLSLSVVRLHKPHGHCCFMPKACVCRGIFKAISAVGQAGADELVKTSIDGGINFFDAADNYTEGESEKILGQALKKP